MGDFAKEVDAFVKGTTKNVDTEVRGITMALFRGVIMATPVDTGRARGNWQTTVDVPASGTVPTLDPTGGAATAQVQQRMGGLGKKTYLTNNLPYIEMLEYGGYRPGPKTIGGYSRQAPRGMVRVTMARIGKLLREQRRTR